MTNTLIRSIALAGAASLALAITPSALAKNEPAPVPVAATTTVAGIGVANLEEAAARSNAFTAANDQRKVTYKATYDAAQTRGNALNAQLKAMVDAYQAAAKKPGATQAALAPQAEAIQKLQQSGRQEIQQILMPAALSEAYVNEQISDKLDAAVQQAMTKYRVSLLLNPQAVLARSQSYDLTSAITAELNTLLPSAQLVPPQGWLPREVREAQAQQGGAAPAPRPATPPAGPQPDGR